MPRTDVHCYWCGTSFAHEEPRRFCCKECLHQWRAENLAAYNQTRNPMNQPGGVLAARVKRSQVMRGGGSSYRKLLGRHEHRTLATEMIGRDLRPGEVVHHVDHDRRNNDPENLAVLPSQSDHVRLHRRARGRWCE